jgi:anti-anti-sigma factor
VPLAISTERRGELEIVELRGELTRVTVGRFRAALADYEPAEARLVLDLSGLTWFDSSGVTALVEVARRCGHARRMGMIAPEPTLRRKLETMSLRRAFALAPDLPSAERVLAAEPGAPNA